MEISPPPNFVSRRTIFPLPCGRIDESKELKRGDCLWVEVHPDRPLPQQCVRLVEGAQDLALARACVANDKDGVSDVTQFLQLHHFQDKVLFSLQTQFLQEAKSNAGKDKGERKRTAATG